MAPDDDPQPDPFGVAAIITNDRGEILMHLRDDIPGIQWPGYWSLPSGIAEPGESPAEAMSRELDEETGLTISLAQRLEFPKRPEGDRVVLFTGSWDGDPAALNLTEGVKLQFYPPGDLIGMLVPPWVIQAVRRLQDTGSLVGS